jgi:hypothetical protein
VAVVVEGNSVGAAGTVVSDADELPQAHTAASNADSVIARRPDRQWTNVDVWRMELLQPVVADAIECVGGTHEARSATGRVMPGGPERRGIAPRSSEALN